MKKLFRKTLSALLVIALLLGAMSITTFAAEETTVEIISNNVQYGETLKLMYAVDAANLKDGDEIVLEIRDYNGNAVAARRLANQVVREKDCAIFVSEKGVPSQNIAAEFTATAKVVRGGETVATSATTTYSVLEYFFERILVSASTTDLERAAHKAHIEYAAAAEAYFYPEERETKIPDYAYVRVAENGSFGGRKAAMVKIGTSLADIVSTLTPDSKNLLVWDAVSYGTDFSVGNSLTYEKEEISALTAQAGAIILTPRLVEVQTGEVKELVTFEFGANSEPGKHNETTSAMTANNNSFLSTDGSTTLTFTTYTLVYYKEGGCDAMGNSAIKIGKGDESAKLVFTVDENVMEVVIKVATYKNKTSQEIVVNGVTHTITTMSDNGDYTEIKIDTSLSKTVEISSNRKNSTYAFMMDSITFWGYEE